MNEKGKGRVVNGDFVSKVEYKIEINREFTSSGTPLGMHINLYLFNRLPEIPLSDTAYTLELEDGQRILRFVVRSIGVFEPTMGITART